MMFQNTKTLIFACCLIIFLGFNLFWFGGFTSEEPRLTSEVSSNEVKGIEGERAFVLKVVDGDTIKLENGSTVRLIGIDTPETVDPKRSVGCFGKEASDEVKKLLTGKEIIMQKDISDKDKYDRLLRLIFLSLPDGQILFVNDYLVRAGFARVMTYPPDIKYNEKFRIAESEAKQSKLGLWGKCN